MTPALITTDCPPVRPRLPREAAGDRGVPAGGLRRPGLREPPSRWV